MSDILGVPNKYDQEIEWRTVEVADQSELPAAMQEAAKDGWFPMPGAFGKMKNALAIKPTFYILVFRMKEPAVTL